MDPFVSVAPGRLCLFGEHQDYLGWPVIALSIPLACRIEVHPKNDDDGSSRRLELRVPALNKIVVYDLDNLPQRKDPHNTAEPDFALAAIHEAVAEGWTFACGADCISTSDIIMKAGCSSSSAFCVAWVNVLATLANKSLTPVELAVRAHRAEVLHFDAPGGTMDHVTSAVGGLLRIGPGHFQYESLPLYPPNQMGVWVLAYSGEPKDTLHHLKRCKEKRLELFDKIDGNWDTNDNSSLDHLDKLLLKATLTNRDTEKRAASLWEAGPRENMILGQQLGDLMKHHHEALRDGLLVSTTKLESLNNAALDANAWGFKVVGSGGGGCGVAWTDPDNATCVRKAMEKAGATKVWIIDKPAPRAAIHKVCDR